MNKKTLLVVGAGYGQIPAIKVAKDIGLRVLTVDRDQNAPGMVLADESFLIDIMDKESVLTLAIKQKIDGIITLQSDHGVPTVGYINDHLGMKGVSLETAINCSHKTKCRIKLKEKNCAQPDFKFVRNISEAIKAVNKIGIPCVIKASDSSGSRGITKISSLEGIEKGVKEAFQHTKLKEIIVEEFVDGIEFGAQTFSVNGKCDLVLLHNDTLSEPPYMIPIGHSFPFKDLSLKETELAKLKIKEAVEAIGIVDGPANVDIILDSNTREIKIIEIGARIGATCLPELVEYHTGINWVEQAIKSAIGESVNLTQIINQPVAAEIIFSKKNGVFWNYEHTLKPDDFNVIEFELTVKEGENVSMLRKGTDRIGKIITIGKTVHEAEQKANKFRQNLNLIIK